MFFTLSKIIWFLISPLSFLWLALGIGGVLAQFKKTKRVGKRLLKTSLILFIALGILPIGYNLQVLFEHESPQIHIDSIKEGDIGGIIILGGCMDAKLTDTYNMPTINGSCERIIEGVKLHNAFPTLPIIYTGGSGSISNQKYKGAVAAKHLMADMGIDTQEIIFEQQSRNTYENMTLSKALAPNHTQKPWLLVTSALHMPRASRVFCEGGWPIIPYPVDFNTGNNLELKLANPSYNYYYLDRVIKETLGIIAYGVTNKLSMNACAKIID